MPVEANALYNARWQQRLCATSRAATPSAPAPQTAPPPSSVGSRSASSTRWFECICRHVGLASTCGVDLSRIRHSARIA
eukprot:2082904-Pleurochrysis_carterae.AAC.3